MQAYFDSFVMFIDERKNLKRKCATESATVGHDSS